MKKVFGTITIVSGVFLTLFIIKTVNANISYAREVGNYWTLADRSSTIEEKSKYINQFVEALEKSRHADNNALVLDTPENSFDLNLKALKSLRDRLEEIKTMDVKSFEYQTAIQQITSQEQGDAKEMLSTLKGCWYLGNGYVRVWNWFGITVGCFFGIAFIAGGLFWLFAVIEGD
jgi:hypothetical protein